MTRATAVGPAKSIVASRGWPRHLRVGVLAFALALAGPAEAWTLDALLRLSLERLLTLDITVRLVTQDGGPADAPTAAAAHSGGQHVA